MGTDHHLPGARELKGVVHDVLQGLVGLCPVAERSAPSGGNLGAQNHLASRRPFLVPIDQ